MSMYGMKLRLRIVARCASVILADRTLVVFPFISMSFAVTTLCFFYFTVGPDKMQLMLNTLRNEQGVQTLNLGYYGALATALFLVVSLATAMNFALVNCIRISLDGHKSRIWDGISVVLKRVPAILVWSFLAITLGLLWTLFDQERRSSAVLRRRFGNTWNNMSILTVPVAVLENRNIFGAIARSKTMVQDTWGRNLTAQFGSLWFVAILSIPLIVKYALLWFSGTGLTLPFAEFALVYFACSVILAQTAKAIFKIVLYRYASEGVVTAGFDLDSLKGAFWSPAPERGHTSPVTPIQLATERQPATLEQFADNGEFPPAVCDASQSDTVEPDVERKATSPDGHTPEPDELEEEALDDEVVGPPNVEAALDDEKATSARDVAPDETEQDPAETTTLSEHRS